ncbi:MAG: methionine synthase I [Gammaproteobacteria bacterium]|nr:MAG: methionine synthase I [Gammaproteobacteria bacterium]
MENKLHSLLASRRVLLADGATGTNLFAVGLETGDAPELWNVDHPERIAALHRSFVDAGSDIILTNSFGGTRYRLDLHKAGHRVAELNRRAAEIAREEAERPRNAGDTDRIVLVAGSIGPTGEILEPSGALSIEAASEAFREQAEALAAGGADIFWIETISSKEEIRAAILGTAGLGLPIAFTVSIDTNGRTMMGLTASDTLHIGAELETELEQAARETGKDSVDAPLIAAVGTNCGIGASEVVAAIVNICKAGESLDYRPAFVAKANCGIPEYVDGKIVYNGTPELMSEYVILAANAGARIIGGCCGTTPAHVAAMRKSLDAWTPGPAPTLADIEASLGEVSTGAKAQLAGDLSVAGGSASGRGVRRSRRRRS